MLRYSCKYVEEGEEACKRCFPTVREDGAETTFKC